MNINIEIGTTYNGRKLGYHGHSELYTYDECPSCHKKRWVRKHLIGDLCKACNNKIIQSNPEVLRKKSMTLTGRKRNWHPTEEHKEKIRQSLLGKKHTPEHIEKVRQSTLRMWRNPITRDKLINSLLNMRSPNGHETVMLNLLNENFGNEWKFVANGQVILGGLCPDFINTNGKKLIVEYFGEYWHKPQDEKFRKKVFSQFGYDTLVIWSTEMSNKTAVINKIGKWLT